MSVYVLLRNPNERKTSFRSVQLLEDFPEHEVLGISNVFLPKNFDGGSIDLLPRVSYLLGEDQTKYLLKLNDCVVDDFLKEVEKRNFEAFVLSENAVLRERYTSSRLLIFGKGYNVSTSGTLDEVTRLYDSFPQIRVTRNGEDLGLEYEANDFLCERIQSIEELRVGLSKKNLFEKFPAGFRLNLAVEIPIPLSGGELKSCLFGPRYMEFPRDEFWNKYYAR